MIAAHLDNLLFLLLVAVAVIFQFLAKAAGKVGKDQTKRTSIPRTPAPTPRAPAESDEERIRKLLEALGHPPTSTPPPPVVPRTDIPPRPLAPVQPPMSPLPRLRREILRKRKVIQQESAKPPTGARFEKTVSPQIASTTGAPGFEFREGLRPIAPPQIVEAVSGVTQAIDKKHDVRIGITRLLGSTSDLRDAIILREIIGPPRGLRALDPL